MTNEDPRHGTVAGYNRIPCREKCCRDAMAKYKSMRALDLMAGRERIVSAIGTRRRIQALACLGWSNAEVARRAGMHPEHLPRLVHEVDTITRRTAERIAKVYDALCMQLPVAETRHQKQAITNAKNRAARHGWLPPLAWDDDRIDDPTYRPRMYYRPAPRTDYDPVVVDRFLGGEYALPTTIPERAEIVRRWPDSLNRLEQITGWNTNRYKRRSDVA